MSITDPAQIPLGTEVRLIGAPGMGTGIVRQVQQIGVYAGTTRPVLQVLVEWPSQATVEDGKRYDLSTWESARELHLAAAKETSARAPAEPSPGTRSLLIPLGAADKVLRHLTKLAKTCGTEVTRIAGTTVLTHPEGTGGIECARVTVGVLPRVEGYELVATLEHLEAGNVVSYAPGEAELGEEWRTCASYCAHCKTERRRKETFLVRTPAGEILQIGRNCLADFLTASPVRFIALAELVRSIGGGDLGWGAGARDYYLPETKQFLACAVSAIEHHGFRKSGMDAPTKQRAMFLAMPKPKGSNAEIWREEQPTAAHHAEAEAILAWAQTATPSSDYLWNLRLALGERLVGHHVGLIASAPPAYQRALGIQVKERAARAGKKDYEPGHVAPKGEVFQGEATLEGIVEIANDWGGKSLCRFRTESGHQVVWFASGKAPRTIGNRYQIKGRVKACETFRGVDQTVLQRVSFEELKATTDG